MSRHSFGRQSELLRVSLDSPGHDNFLASPEKQYGGATSGEGGSVILGAVTSGERSRRSNRWES